MPERLGRLHNRLNEAAEDGNAELVIYWTPIMENIVENSTVNFATFWDEDSLSLRCSDLSYVLHFDFMGLTWEGWRIEAYLYDRETKQILWQFDGHFPTNE